MSDTKQLQVIAQESGLEPSKTEVLLSKFGSYFSEAKEIAQGAKDIVVTDETDITTMAIAKEKRLDLKRIRVEAEKTRKELKEQSLREGRAIDGIANVIKALIVPVEEHLEAQEKFAERLIAQKEADTERYRFSELSRYVDDASVYSLHPKNLSDEAFEKLLENSRFAFEAKKKAEEEEKRKLLLAPDKDKLLKMVADIHKIQRPHLESMEASEILENANDLIIKAVEVLQQGAKKL